MEIIKQFDSCPMCHSEQRVLEPLVAEEIRKGKIAVGRIAASQLRVMPLCEATGAVLSAPVLTSFYDICADCGFEYVHVVMKEDLPAHIIDQILGKTVKKN